jgi:DNA-binding NarL/FixJ family response regulator
MIKLDVFDGSPVFLEGLRSVLGANGVTITAKTSTAAGLSWRADVFLFNPAIADVDELQAFIAEASRIAPVLLLVDTVDEVAVLNYVRVGACGLVDRTASGATIVSAIRTVANGGQFWGESGGTQVEPDGPESRETLSPRERQVLRQISRGLTHTQIASRLGISRHTVDTYVKRVRVKLNIGNKAELTRAAVLGSFEPNTPQADEEAG